VVHGLVVHQRVKRGVEISKVSHFLNEEELLLPTGICFQIVTVQKEPSQKYIIQVKI
jgi:hypothetical protein